ncbi:hypothetical protein JCM3770_006870 [Rhodotorula araucariae]
MVTEMGGAVQDIPFFEDFNLKNVLQAIEIAHKGDWRAKLASIVDLVPMVMLGRDPRVIPGISYRDDAFEKIEQWCKDITNYFFQQYNNHAPSRIPGSEVDKKLKVSPSYFKMLVMGLRDETVERDPGSDQVVLSVPEVQPGTGGIIHVKTYQPDVIWKEASASSRL